MKEIIINMIIKNKKKFVKAIFIILGISIGINILITSNTFSHQELKYKTIAVVQGETIWNIAEKEQKSNTYYKGKDVRDIIENIKKINKLQTTSIKTGQKLEIATY